MRAYCLVTGFTFLHYNYVLRPSLNAALWRTLATEAGFRYLGTTVDRVGRTAVAFSAHGADPSRKVILLADPETGAFLGSEEVLVRDSRELGRGAGRRRVHGTGGVEPGGAVRPPGCV